MLAFPPTRSRRSLPLPPHLALQRLQAYLRATESQPSLLPNAMLQSDGPKAQSGAAANLVIHNLKRVEAGLRGEWLAPSLELEDRGQSQDGLDVFAADMGNVFGVGRVEGRPEDESGEGWQDLEEYQREQSAEDGEAGLRETGIRDEGHQVLHVGIGVSNGKTSRTIDKEARKREKRERTSKEKRHRFKAVKVSE